MRLLTRSRRDFSCAGVVREWCARGRARGCRGRCGGACAARRAGALGGRRAGALGARVRGLPRRCSAAVRPRRGRRARGRLRAGGGAVGLGVVRVRGGRVRCGGAGVRRAAVVRRSCRRSSRRSPGWSRWRTTACGCAVAGGREEVALPPGADPSHVAVAGGAGRGAGPGGRADRVLGGRRRGGAADLPRARTTASTSRAWRSLRPATSRRRSRSGMARTRSSSRRRGRSGFESSRGASGSGASRWVRSGWRSSPGRGCREGVRVVVVGVRRARGVPRAAGGRRRFCRARRGRGRVVDAVVPVRGVVVAVHDPGGAVSAYGGRGGACGGRDAGGVHQRGDSPLPRAGARSGRSSSRGAARGSCRRAARCGSSTRMAGAVWCGRNCEQTAAVASSARRAVWSARCGWARLTRLAAACLRSSEDRLTPVCPATPGHSRPAGGAETAAGPTAWSGSPPWRWQTLPLRALSSGNAPPAHTLDGFSRATA